VSAGRAAVSRRTQASIVETAVEEESTRFWELRGDAT
jgi:hypothetical protein